MMSIVRSSWKLMWILKYLAVYPSCPRLQSGFLLMSYHGLRIDASGWIGWLCCSFDIEIVYQRSSAISSCLCSAHRVIFRQRLKHLAWSLLLVLLPTLCGLYIPVDSKDLLVALFIIIVCNNVGARFNFSQSSSWSYALRSTTSLNVLLLDKIAQDLSFQTIWGGSCDIILFWLSSLLALISSLLWSPFLRMRDAGHRCVSSLLLRRFNSVVVAGFCASPVIV
jgi:hypothetical protein